MHLRIIILSLLCSYFWRTISIQLIYQKRNLKVQQNQWYECKIGLMRQNAQLIPTTISITNAVANSVPTFGNYFDYFYFLRPDDVRCYTESVANQSYLFPCPFISNRFTKLRQNYILSQELNEEIDNINDIVFSFIVDNTLFPYPDGAYAYSPINIDVSIYLDIMVSPSYETLGKRLIFINVTIFVIYAVIIIVLICKTRNISKKMSVSQANQTPLLKQTQKDKTIKQLDSDDQEEVYKQENQMKQKDQNSQKKESLLQSNSRQFPPYQEHQSFYQTQQINDT